jgi:hypothetical protein
MAEYSGVIPEFWKFGIPEWPEWRNDPPPLGGGGMAECSGVIPEFWKFGIPEWPEWRNDPPPLGVEEWRNIPE